MSRLFITLFILGIAVTGLFFSYNQGYIQIPGQNSQDKANNSDNSTPAKPPEGDKNLEKQVKVDLSRQKAFLYENGNFVREYAISSGLPETPTPTGKFKVIYKQDMLYSKITECWLGFWVGFKGNYGFHETPICEGKRQGEDKIGTPASAGCLRLKLGDAEHFYNWVEISTPIEIY